MSRFDDECKKALARSAELEREGYKAQVDSYSTYIADMIKSVARKLGAISIVVKNTPTGFQVSLGEPNPIDDVASLPDGYVAVYINGEWITNVVRKDALMYQTKKVEFLIKDGKVHSVQLDGEHVDVSLAQSVISQFRKAGVHL